MAEHRLLLSAILGLALCAAAPAARAADCTFFVRAGFEPAEGVADGRSPQRAFGSISDGVRAVQNAGDVVCVGPGLYLEGDINPIQDGAPGAPALTNFPITIRGDATGESTDDPSGPVRIAPPSGLPPEATPGAAFRILGRHDVVIEGFEISGFADAGIQIRSATVGGMNSRDVTVRHNRIQGCRTGIDVYAEGMIVIEHNRVIGNAASGISIDSCLLPDLFGPCRGLPSQPVVPIVSNNRIGGNGAHGIFVRNGLDAIIQNNVVYANAFTGITLRGVPDALVVNNLVYRSGEEGLAIGSGFVAPEETIDPAAFASPNAIVLNNTLYGSGEWGVEVGNPFAASPGAALTNNIIWANGDGRLGVGVLNERGQQTVRKPSVCGYVAGFNAVLDEYGPDTPRNAYDLAADPLFVDLEGPDGVIGGEVVDGQFLDRSADDDFRLRQGNGPRSPLVDAGATTTARLGLTGSTAVDGRADDGQVDLGFHYGASAEQGLTYDTPFMPLFVRAGGDDIGDGMAPTSAFASIRTAARRARAGVTVVVGPGVYRECDIKAPPDSGRASFLADPAGERTGDAPGVTLVDAGRCYFDPVAEQFTPGATGFNLASVCGAVIDGFHVTGASDDGIQVQRQADGAQVRNNVVFANAKRGINVINSYDVRIANNLAVDNNGGLQVGSGALSVEQCGDGGGLRAIVEHNTAHANRFNGILIGAGACPSTGATVRYNITGENGRTTRAGGIEVGSDETREANLVGYSSRYNLVADRYAAGVPRGVGDLLVDPAFEPLFVDPRGVKVTGDWRLDGSFRLRQRAAGQGEQARAVDFSDLSALRAGLGSRSTRTDGGVDEGLVDLGYHYPSGGQRLIGDCDGDAMVTVNEIILAVNIALGNATLSACPAASADGERVVIADLIAAVNALLLGPG